MAVNKRPHFQFLDKPDGQPILFAHQGGAEAKGPNPWNVRNTMIAFDAAYKLGIRHFETDTVSTADGGALAFHGSDSPKEEIMTGLPQRARLEAMTAAEIHHSIRVFGQEIPMLNDVLQTWPDVRVNIDPKTDKSVLPTAAAIRLSSAADRVCVTSFDYSRTKAVADEFGGQKFICTGLARLGGYALKLGVDSYLENTEAACLQLPYNHTSAKMVERAHKHGLGVHVWTPNQYPDIISSMKDGVDGIMTDELRVGLRAMQAFKQGNFAV